MKTIDDRITIPLYINEMGLFDVEVTINQFRGRFHLDTGASQSCLDRQHVSRFALDEQELDYEAMGLGGSQKVSQVTIDSLKVNDHTIGRYDLFVIDLSHVNTVAVQLGAEPIDGVLGNDFLRQYHAIIDCGAEEMYLQLD